MPAMMKELHQIKRTVRQGERVQTERREKHKTKELVLAVA